MGLRESEQPVAHVEASPVHYAVANILRVSAVRRSGTSAKRIKHASKCSPLRSKKDGRLVTTAGTL